MMIPRALFWLLCFNALVNGQPHPDMATMTALKNSLKSSKLDWSDPNPCVWTGVGCDARSHRVTRITLDNKEISGTLAPELKSLSLLTVFEVMGNNNLTGKIPSLAGLKSLETFNVHDNGFTSIDADFFTGLSSLEVVILGNNPLDPWEIPSSLGSAKLLQVFSAVNCNLSGKIPDFLGGFRFPHLRVLKLSGNSLVGELPIDFIEFSVLRVLKLNGQKGNEKLNGSISFLQSMFALTDVWLQENAFSGPIPDLSFLVCLKMFNVSGNQLTGTVPSSLTESKSLSHVALGNNLLQGPTPSFKSAKADMSGVNSFCLDTAGTPCDPRVNTLLSIVAAFGYPARFAQSWKGNDPCNTKSMWVGITCTGADITVINFKNMSLTGTISPRFADLASVRVIDLSQNNLYGASPQELTKLSNLTTLDVSNNRLCVPVPDFKPNVVVNISGNFEIRKDDPASSSGNGGKKATSNAGFLLLVTLFSSFAFRCPS